MRMLVVHSHPDPESYSAALRATVMEGLAEAGHETRLVDLYAEGFDPVLSRAGWRDYEDSLVNARGLEPHVEALKWAEGIVFVYPTWWYGLPAMLKGWLDRVWLPEVAFTLPPGEPIAPLLTHIRRCEVVTTCGASWWLTQLVGSPGKRTILRGCRFLMAKDCRTRFLAHYRMDASTPESRARFLKRVRRAMAKP